MQTQRQLFLSHCAQTSEEPMGINVEKAKGVFIWDADGKEYIDLISGISVNNSGHLNDEVVSAIKKQLDDYSYLMVYGEYLHSPQIKLSKWLCDQLPKHLNSTFLVNSGSEAIEGAIKLAKRYTGRSKIMAFEKSYHGSTYAALSLGGDYERKQAFAPFMPGVVNVKYNDLDVIDQIDNSFAAVVMEPIQAEAGIIVPRKGFLQKIKQKCEEHNVLLILDEVQTGIGRTGRFFAFEHFNIEPDVLVLAKGLGGGMPIGAFISSNKIMSVFKNNPVLGHITTFGGHPVSCAAAYANINFIKREGLVSTVKKKEKLFKKHLTHPAIIEIRSFGLMIAVEFESPKINMSVIKKCISMGVLTDWFLYADHCLRIAPPLIITEEQIKQACDKIMNSIESVTQ